MPAHAITRDPEIATPAVAPPEVVIEDDRMTPWRMLRDTWIHRALLPRIGTRIVVKGYAGTKLGRSWLFLRPTISIVALSLLFGGVLNAPSNGVPYLIFLLVGMACWMAFERFLFWATRSFDTYHKHAVNFDLPLLLIPTAGAAVAAIEFGVIALLTAIATAWFWVADGEFYLDLGPQSALAVAGLGLALLLAWGLGMWLSALNLMARDVRIVLRYVFTIWLYTTPVIYSTDALTGFFGVLATFNPMTAPVLLFKQGVLGVGSIEPAALVISISITTLALVSGLWFFTRNAARLLREDHFVMDDEEDVP